MSQCVTATTSKHSAIHAINKLKQKPTTPVGGYSSCRNARNRHDIRRARVASRRRSIITPFIDPGSTGSRPPTRTRPAIDSGNTLSRPGRTTHCHARRRSRATAAAHERRRATGLALSTGRLAACRFTGRTGTGAHDVLGTRNSTRHGPATRHATRTVLTPSPDRLGKGILPLQRNPCSTCWIQPPAGHT